jgi:hypothetical protein
MTLETIATLSDDATVSLPDGRLKPAGERNEAAGSYTTAGDTISLGTALHDKSVNKQLFVKDSVA